MADPISHEDFVKHNISRAGADPDFRGLTNIWLREAIRHNYAQNFNWLGRPIIQIPQDMYAIQELIWRIKPDLVIETGIAHGGSLILSASMLALLDYSEAVESGGVVVPRQSKRRVIGVDIDIRPHNRSAIETHPMAHMIELIQGSSTAAEIVDRVRSRARDFKRVLVFLDSNHTHDHVLAELEAYASLVSRDSYCVVWDTGVEDLPEGFVTDRPWGKGNNPKTAVLEFLRGLQGEGRKSSTGEPLHFEIDKMLEYKIVITASSDGFLRRIS